MVFYAQGWRLDLETLAVRKVGALYVRPYPADALIFLNHARVQKGFTFFDRGTFVGDLFPKRYTLTVTREGYRTRESHIAVNPSLVTEFKYAVLIPRTKALYAPDVKNVWISEGKTIFESATGTLRTGDVSFPRRTFFALAKDGRTALLRNGKNYFLADLEGGTAANLTALLSTQGIEGPFPEGTLVPLEGGTAVAVNVSTSLSLVDLQTGGVRLLDRARGATRPFAASPAALAWAGNRASAVTSTLTIYDLFSNTARQITNVPPHRVTALAWQGNTLTILTAQGDFFTYSPRDEHLQKIAADTRQFFFSDDGAMVAALEHKSIEVFSPDTNDYWRFNLPSTDRIERLIWYRDNRHLFVVYPDRTAFLDLDDASLENFDTVVPTNRVAYDAASNRLYFIEDGALKMTEFAR